MRDPGCSTEANADVADGQRTCGTLQGKSQDKEVDMPGAVQHTVPNIQVSEDVEVLRVQFVEDVVDASMSMASPSTTVEVAQKTVEVPDVEIPMVMQRQGSNIQAVHQTADVPHEGLLSSVDSCIPVSTAETSLQRILHRSLEDEIELNGDDQVDVTQLFASSTWRTRMEEDRSLQSV